jgi:hypothetical protein
VSLPFSDHCDPLVDSDATQASLLAHLGQNVHDTGCRYAEVRLSTGERAAALPPDYRIAATYYAHTISLAPSIDRLYSSLHKDCVQRKVRRGEREGLRYQAGRSDDLLREFYRLLLLTRRRHGVPPQPLRWFRQLTLCMGKRVSIRVASKNGRAVAAILSLVFNGTVTYKYGCSDARYHHLGGTPFLFWKLIHESKDEGRACIDLGRSDVDNAGLVTFKDRMGARRGQLHYCRVGRGPTSRDLPDTWRSLLHWVARRTPGPVLQGVGSLLYRHMG